MQLTELNELVDELSETRKSKDIFKQAVAEKKAEFEESIKEHLEKVKKLEQEVEEIQHQILEALKESGSKSWKTEKATVSRKSTFSYSVRSKQEVLHYLEEKGLTDEYTSVELAPHIKALYEQAEVPGVEKVEKEFISVIVK